MTTTTLIGQTGGEVVEVNWSAKTITLSVAFDMDEGELSAVSALDAEGWDVEVVWMERE